MKMAIYRGALILFQLLALLDVFLFILLACRAKIFIWVFAVYTALQFSYPAFELSQVTDSSLQAQAIGKLVAAFIFFVPWLCYLLISKKSKNVFSKIDSI